MILSHIAIHYICVLSGSNISVHISKQSTLVHQFELCSMPSMDERNFSRSIREKYFKGMASLYSTHSSQCVWRDKNKSSEPSKQVRGSNGPPGCIKLDSIHCCEYHQFRNVWFIFFSHSSSCMLCSLRCNYYYFVGKFSWSIYI